ncbi:MAG: hypothetical protein E7416_03675 [Ruminococcaceae bacterium]|nr:hypothetical protein [Oscillospiraceae bacterium]
MKDIEKIVNCGNVVDCPKVSMVSLNNSEKQLYNAGWMKGYKTGCQEGFEEGYDRGLAEGSSHLEDSYIDGYKDCLFSEPPEVEDDELRDLLEQGGFYDDEEDCPEDMSRDGLYISGDILHLLEELKKDLHEIRGKIISPWLTDDEQRALSLRMLNIIKRIGDVQTAFVVGEVYKYLGYTD